MGLRFGAVNLQIDPFYSGIYKQAKRPAVPVEKQSVKGLLALPLFYILKLEKFSF